MSGLLIGCAVQKHVNAVSSTYTFVNYETGVTVAVKNGQTDRGEPLPFRGSLRSSSKIYSGATSATLGKSGRIPDWVEISWVETRPGWDMSYNDYLSLKKEERAERASTYATLPVRSAKIDVRRRIPVEIIEDLNHSRLDHEHANLPPKSLRLYVIWTNEGLKMRWRVYGNSPKVLYEGGDKIL